VKTNRLSVSAWVVSSLSDPARAYPIPFFIEKLDAPPHVTSGASLQKRQGEETVVCAGTVSLVSLSLNGVDARGRGGVMAMTVA